MKSPVTKQSTKEYLKEVQLGTTGRIPRQVYFSDVPVAAVIAPRTQEVGTATV